MTEGDVGMLLMILSALIGGGKIGFQYARKNYAIAGIRGDLKFMMLIFFSGMLLFEPTQMARSESAIDAITTMATAGAILTVVSAALSTGFFFLFNKFAKRYVKTLPE